ncbi:MAG TPA: PLP-dependent transferase [Sphingomicrobium sp.]|nr:PLP-dependent transferase [Sphingomicrobium sp.]
MSRRKGPGTIVAAARPDFDPSHGAIAPPVWASDTFRWDSPEDKPSFDYSRTVNPNRSLLIDVLAELEGASGGVVTGSGQSAALLTLLRLPVGARVVAPHDCYGGTFRLLSALAAQGKIRCDFVDQTSAEAFDHAFDERLDLLWIESPSNPLLRLTDIASWAGAAKGLGALVVADNTLPTPARQRPLDLGCDLVVHSTTKALNGHNDLFGGAVLGTSAALIEELDWWSNAAGLNGSAHDSAQTLRGLRTLHVRVDRQESSAARLAGWLAEHPQIRAVHYPGLSSHPAHRLAASQQSGPGFILSFQVKGGGAAAGRFVSALRLITLASSLGGFASLICVPATMTHRGMPPEAQQRAGIHPDLLRLSVGLEDPDDLQADLERGFAEIR